MLIDRLALHTDKYQINMMYAHWINGTHTRKAVFEAYFRKLPFGNGFAVFAGLERIVEYIKHLHFTERDLAYLAKQEENYKPEFLELLRNFRFRGTLYSMKEGAFAFPNEPLIRVEGNVLETQLVETALLNFMNYQTLIATKAARVKQVAQHDILLEFGTRRAQEADAAVWGARAAYIAGFDATSNTLAGELFNIPTKGTHAHSWVQFFDSEYEAFERYARALPGQVTLLVDTYDTLGSGVPNAIKVAKWMESEGKQMTAIRLDSGDLAHLSIEARRMLDEAGLPDVKIVASNDLDENTIFNLKAQGAKIDTWGIGTQLITAADQPALGGVYKLVERQKDGEMVPTIKISGNPEKISTPGKKEVYRLISRKDGRAMADYIAYPNEVVTGGDQRLKLLHPVHASLQKTAKNFEPVKMLVPIFEEGELVYDLPNLQEIKAYHQEQLELFRPEYLRKLNPEIYHVTLSQEVWNLRQNMIESYLAQNEE